VSFFSPHNWMAFVHLNKRHVMLCYVILSAEIVGKLGGRGKVHTLDIAPLRS